MRPKLLWLLFAIVQVAGALIPLQGNLHTNIWPLFGLLLLAPGIGLMAIFDFELTLSQSVALAIPANALIFYLMVIRPRSSVADQ